MPARDKFDAVVVGGGHNGLVAAAYLARAGRSVLVLERLPGLGGAAVTAAPFAGVDVRLSRYAYLVGLLPAALRRELGVRTELRARPVAGYAPTRRSGRPTGLLVEATPGPTTADSFAAVTGSATAFARWRQLQEALASLATRLAPTLLEPLRTAPEMRSLLGSDLWTAVVERPLGESLADPLPDPLVRGVTLTDGLIGTLADPAEPSLRQNRCFLYHVLAAAFGGWRIPVGGTGAVTAELARVARATGAELRTAAEVTAVDADGSTAEITYTDGVAERRVGARFVLADVAPATLARLRCRPPEMPAAEGAQLKVNLVLTRLPRLASGIDPRVAFAGTLHVDEDADSLARAFAAAGAGRLPEPIPVELYCQTLTDPSVLGPVPRAAGWHVVTAFTLQTPARLFAGPAAQPVAARETALTGVLAGLDAQLAEPIEPLIARTPAGTACVEMLTPADLEAELGMPGGHIFHGDLAWPWAETADEAGRWGVETDVANVLRCGAGARRGGGVSGIGGHNAARAALAAFAARAGAGSP